MLFTKLKAAFGARFLNLSHKPSVETSEETLLKLSMHQYSTIPAELFYRILNKRELLHLLILSQESERLSLTEEQKLELENQWCDIEHEYHIKSKNSEYQSSLNEAARNITESAKLLTILLLFQKYRYNMADGIEELAKLGVKGDMEEIIRKINQIIGRNELRQAKMKKATDQEELDYYAMIARVNTVNGYHVPSNILLCEWVGILSVIKENKHAR